jgi:hypothetical protein
MIAAFWLSSNLVLDFLVMPVMYVSGMMTQADFATASYSLFWSFNRLELLCAAVILTGILALRRRPSEFEVSHCGSRCRWALAIAVGLLSLALVDTYFLAPSLSTMALALDAVNPVVTAPAMNWMHIVYWGFESLKLASLLGLAGLCLRDLRDADAAPGVWS